MLLLAFICKYQGSKYRISGSYRMGGFSYRISDIGDTRAYRAFILDTIYNEILITKIGLVL